MKIAEPTTTDWLAKRQTYRRLMTGSIFGGTAVALVLRSLGYPILGEGVYWIGILAFSAIWLGTDIQLMDERDRELERRASLSALKIVGPVLVVGASSARLLTWLTDVTVPAMVWGALYGYVGLFVAFGIAYLWHRSRR
jgi:hypothetical protein